MSDAELHYLSISEAAARIRRRELSPVELVEAHLRRIESTNGRLNSFLTVTADQARNAARDAEQAVLRGESLGPLHGIPIGLKDLYFTKGIRTTVGSKIMADFVPDFDATAVEHVRRAGAIALGKQQMHEFALGGTSENPHWGPSRNPWDVERLTGGSSGGGAAGVAAGLCMAALGTDTGGSVRIPASLCGVAAIKPTYGRVSRHGVFPLSWTLDTPGPIARSVRDVAIVLGVIAGHDPSDETSANRPSEDFERLLGQDVRGLRIGIPRQYFFDHVDSEVESAVRDAARSLADLGASVEEVSIPAFEIAGGIFGPILLAEAATIHLEDLRKRPADFDPDVRTRLEMGALTPAVVYLQAQRARARYDRELAEAMRSVDILLTPTTPVTAPRIDEKTVTIGDYSELTLVSLPRLTRPFNVCGLPTASVPCGFSGRGLPIGLQLTGRAFEDATVLQVAHAYEQASHWWQRRPELVSMKGSAP